LQFNTNTDLELYRVNTLFEKEPETIAWIDSWSEGRFGYERVFFDIGANIGIFSLYASHRFDDINTFSFEPVSDNYAALVSNIKLNNMGNVKAFNFAISDQNKLMNLYINDLRVGNSGAQINLIDNEKQKNFHAVRIESVISFSLDKLIDEFEFPVPNYVKIDVDGHETAILSGMIKVMAHERLRSILIEFNDINELNLWSDNLKKIGLVLDSSFDNVLGHSRFRRTKNSNTAMNCIFSKR
jgi:FkbM family methyltransferase